MTIFKGGRTVKEEKKRRPKKLKKRKSKRSPAAGLEKEPLSKRLKRFWYNFYNLYSSVELIVLFILFFGGNTAYIYYLTREPFVSAIFGIIGLVFFFLVFSYKDRKLKAYQGNLRYLLKYVNNMSFMLNSGENVMRSLESSINSVNDEIGKDIEKTIEIMKEKTMLDTSHFEKYDFPSLDQFHQNLAVKYDRGGDAKELFDLIQKRMVSEIQKRDELLGKRKGMKMNIMMMVIMVLGIAVMMAMMLPNLWADFLTFKVAGVSIICSFYVFNLILMHFMQKKAVDISVRL
ncbi:MULTISPECIES: type II secretion system F family protein [Bacillaceae]|uniref:type II secretion system F family protein n=1 Tax=Bacillaceae TaxID=186817 RepID=UPI000694DE7B|nr:type II secretion system F family protein [Bacillus rubiinfantis]